jgi:hypothetical protein
MRTAIGPNELLEDFREQMGLLRGDHLRLENEVPGDPAKTMKGLYPVALCAKPLKAAIKRFTKKRQVEFVPAASIEVTPSYHDLMTDLFDYTAYHLVDLKSGEVTPVRPQGSKVKGTFPIRKGEAMLWTDTNYARVYMYPDDLRDFVTLMAKKTLPGDTSHDSSPPSKSPNAQ